MNIDEVKKNAMEAGGKLTHFYLSWYQSVGDDLIGQELLDVSEEEIRKWFWLQPDDPQLDGLIVRNSQRQQLQQRAKHKIDLNQFDYIVEYLFVYDNTM